MSINPVVVGSKTEGNPLTSFDVKTIDTDTFEFDEHVHSMNVWDGDCGRETYKGVLGLQLDFDSGKTIDEVREMFKDYKNVVYTSNSHLADGATHKVHVLLPFASDEPQWVTLKDGDMFYRAAKALFPTSDHKVLYLHMKLFPNTNGSYRKYVNDGDDKAYYSLPSDAFINANPSEIPKNAKIGIVNDNDSSMRSNNYKGRSGERIECSMPCCTGRARKHQGTNAIVLDAGLYCHSSETFYRFIDYKKGLHSFVRRIITNNMNLTFKRNVRSMADECGGEVCTDTTIAKIREKCGEFGVYNRQVIEDVVNILFDENRFDELEDWQNDLKAMGDCSGSIDKMLSYFNFKGQDFASIVVKKWMVGCIARLKTSEFNPVLTIGGAQGIGKSQWAEWLCSGIRSKQGSYFLDKTVRPNDKDDKLKLGGLFLWEIAEVQATTRYSDVEALKSFLSTRSIDERPAYGRYSVHMKPIANFIATYNPKGTIFTDTTGGRRWYILHLDGLDWGYSNDLDPNSVWSESLTLYEGGFDYKFSVEEEKVLRELVEEETALPEALEDIERLLAGCGGVVQTLVLRNKLRLEDSRFNSKTDQALDRWIAEAMLYLGWEKCKVNGQRGYKDSN